MVSPLGPLEWEWCLCLVSLILFTEIPRELPTGSPPRSVLPTSPIHIPLPSVFGKETLVILIFNLRERG